MWILHQVLMTQTTFMYSRKEGRMNYKRKRDNISSFHRIRLSSYIETSWRDVCYILNRASDTQGCVVYTLRSLRNSDEGQLTMSIIQSVTSGTLTIWCISQTFCGFLCKVYCHTLSCILCMYNSNLNVHTAKNVWTVFIVECASINY